jgi:uncharacterized protein YlxW (UPF0749 family)
MLSLASLGRLTNQLWSQVFISIFVIPNIASRGRSHYLLKSSRKEEENRAMQVEEKAKEREHQAQVSGLENEIHALQNELKDADEKMEKMKKNSDILSDLFEKGIIDDNGNLIQND